MLRIWRARKWDRLQWKFLKTVAWLKVYLEGPQKDSWYDAYTEYISLYNKKNKLNIVTDWHRIISCFLHCKPILVLSLLAIIIFMIVPKSWNWDLRNSCHSPHQSQILEEMASYHISVVQNNKVFHIYLSDTVILSAEMSNTVCWRMKNNIVSAKKIT